MTDRTSIAGVPEDAVWIVGAGVIGLSCAFELIERGVPVALVERGSAGWGASRAAAGMLAPIAEAETDEDPATRLALRSAAHYPDFIRRLESASGQSCGFREDGSLWVAVDRDDAAHLDHLERTLKDKGLPSRRIERTELLKREPFLTGRVQGALELAADRQVDPRRLCEALKTALSRRGVPLFERTELVSLAAGGRGFLMELRGRDRDVPAKVHAGVDAGVDAEVGTEWHIDAQRILVTCGAHSTPFLKALGEQQSVRPVKGQLIRLRGEPILQSVVRTPDVYLVPREDGELLVGATLEEVGFDAQPTAGAVLDLLRYAWRVLPGIYDLALDEISVGFRPATVDHHPRIGPLEVPGAFAAIGHYRNGVLLAPATAAGIADWIADGEPPEWLREFAPQAAGGL